jgi:hypothetical protein
MLQLQIDPSYPSNRASGVIVRVLALCAVDREFELRSGQTKDYEIGICCFSAKHAALKCMSNVPLELKEQVTSGSSVEVLH